LTGKCNYILLKKEIIWRYCRLLAWPYQLIIPRNGNPINKMLHSKSFFYRFLTIHQCRAQARPTFVKDGCCTIYTLKLRIISHAHNVFEKLYGHLVCLAVLYMELTFSCKLYASIFISFKTLKTFRLFQSFW
jgi:hypothetical protein